MNNDGWLLIIDIYRIMNYELFDWIYFCISRWHELLDDIHDRIIDPNYLNSHRYN